MKNIINSIIIITAIVFCACNSSSNKSEQQTPVATMPPKKVDTTTAKFAHLNFASKKDTICGMPLRLGIEDTLVLNGKIYGFCGTGCKDEFVARLKKQHKR